MMGSAEAVPATATGATQSLTQAVAAQPAPAFSVLAAPAGVAPRPSQVLTSDAPPRPIAPASSPTEQVLLLMDGLQPVQSLVRE